MTAEIAHGLTWLAAACALLLVFASWRLPDLAVPAALALGWLWLWIAGLLLWAFWTVDLSVAAVAANTHSHLPEGLRLAAAVLRPGGSWPVAAALVALGAAGVALVRPRSRRLLFAAGVSALALHVVVLGVASPFVRLSPAPTEGAGFAPQWRERLAAIGGTASPSFTGPLAVGETQGRTRLAAVTPVAGPDSTGVVAQVMLDDVALVPEWRETLLPRHAYSVPDTVWHDGRWWRATLGAPRADGSWPVTVAPLRLRPVEATLAILLAGGLVWWRRR